MKITPEIWHQVNMLDKALRRRGDSISRQKISNALKVNDNIAKFLSYAIDNKDVINLKLSEIEVNRDVELILADVHVPFHDELCLDLALKEAEKRKVTIITILGDLIDFYKISRFTKNPTKKSVSNEINQAEALLQKLRGLFPDARIIYMLGNHEKRLEHYICENASEIFDLIENLLPEKLKLKDKNIEYRTAPFKIGRLWHLHGHEKPNGGNPEWVCNVVWKYVHDHFVVGHFHRSQEKMFPHIDGVTKYIGAAVGAMACLKKLDYAVLSQWNNGFCIVEYDEQGNFRIDNKKIVNGGIY